MTVQTERIGEHRPRSDCCANSRSAFLRLRVHGDERLRFRVNIFRQRGISPSSCARRDGGANHPGDEIFLQSSRKSEGKTGLILVTGATGAQDDHARGAAR